MTKYWILVFTIGIFTYLKRASFIIFLSNWEMPRWMRKSLQFVPVTIFPALVAPLIFMTNGQLDLSPTNIKIISALITLIVATRFGNLLLSIVGWDVGFVGWAVVFGDMVIRIFFQTLFFMNRSIENPKDKSPNLLITQLPNYPRPKPATTSAKIPIPSSISSSVTVSGGRKRTQLL